MNALDHIILGGATAIVGFGFVIAAYEKRREAYIYIGVAAVFAGTLHLFLGSILWP